MRWKTCTWRQLWSIIMARTYTSFPSKITCYFKSMRALSSHWRNTTPESEVPLSQGSTLHSDPDKTLHLHTVSPKSFHIYPFYPQLGLPLQTNQYIPINSFRIKRCSHQWLRKQVIEGRWGTKTVRLILSLFWKTKMQIDLSETFGGKIELRTPYPYNTQIIPVIILSQIHSEVIHYLSACIDWPVRSGAK